METNLSYSDSYQEYIASACPDISTDLSAQIQSQLDSTEWDDPEISRDFNNVAVIALVLAEETKDLSLRSMYLETAIEALREGVNENPLCAAHLALIYSMIGDTQSAIQAAFSVLVETMHQEYSKSFLEPGIIYLPPDKSQFSFTRAELLVALLMNDNAYKQATMLCADILRRSQLVFYNAGGMRFLQLTSQLFPNSSFIQLSLGLSYLFNHQWEGLLNLHKSQSLNINSSQTYQALVLAYRALQNQEKATIWSNQARLSAKDFEDQGQIWKWLELPLDSPFLYVPFGENLLLAVESNIKSIVTNILITEGDWFEAEMEFWRQQIKPGMIVIDVGANVGVYTFSAAEKVGSSGKVLAVEPFKNCTQLMQKTCELNNIDWVTIYEGAASNKIGTLRLSLHGSSELNEVLSDKEDGIGNTVEVPSFTLDSLIEKKGINKVDWLKIDAEGHEIQVLQGCSNLLDQYAPGIMYENIAGSQRSNTPVAEYLHQKGYQLFRYQPYLHNLVPIESLNDLQGTLNVIALKK